MTTKQGDSVAEDLADLRAGGDSATERFVRRYWDVSRGWFD